MINFPAGLAGHLALDSTTLAYAIKITRKDGVVFGFTSHDADVTIGGLAYLSNLGFDASQIVIAADLAVGNLELTTLHDGALFTLVDILDKVWSNAAFEVFFYDFVTPANGIGYSLVGTFGELTLRQNTVVVELRDLRQYLQQTVGSVSCKTCRNRLGDARCRKNLTAFTVTGSVSGGVTSHGFIDSARAEAVDYFTEGEATFLTGANAGRTVKIKTSATGGVFVLALPIYTTLVVGDTYRAIAGCRHRLDEDCIGKFQNVLNYNGEPHRRGLNSVTAPADGHVQ